MILIHVARVGSAGVEVEVRAPGVPTRILGGAPGSTLYHAVECLLATAMAARDADRPTVLQRSIGPGGTWALVPESHG